MIRIALFDRLALLLWRRRRGLRSRLRLHIPNDLKVDRSHLYMLASHKFQPSYHDEIAADVGIDYSPRKIYVATTVVTGKSPLSFRELHRSGATSYYHKIDPGLATFRSGEAQAEAIYVIIHFRERMDGLKYVQSRIIFPKKDDTDTLSHLTHQVILLCRYRWLFNKSTSKKVYAVYGGNKKLRIVLGTSLALGALASMLFMSLEVPSGHVPITSLESMFALFNEGVLPGLHSLTCVTSIFGTGHRSILTVSTDNQLLKVEGKSPLILLMDEPQVFHTTSAMRILDFLCSYIRSFVFNFLWRIEADSFPQQGGH
ncbi:hypothetical protein BU17DRAFT_63780 [Hysterangium stoloniferum]|nr:hypothetical protein BU17DRAFT_63780 [Hysterangium stoloniferum]